MKTEKAHHSLQRHQLSAGLQRLGLSISRSVPRKHQTPADIRPDVFDRLGSWAGHCVRYKDTPSGDVSLDDVVLGPRTLPGIRLGLRRSNRRVINISKLEVAEGPYQPKHPLKAHPGLAHSS